MNLKLVLFLFFGIVLTGTYSYAQADINAMDANGQRHGVWKKKFSGTNQLRYEGQFEHGKEVGLFKFYCEDCGTQPMVTKSFNAENNIAEVKYFTAKGKLVSEGKMDGKKRIGEWVYYQKSSDKIMTKENYVDGLLHGAKTTYYPHGQVTDEVNYVNGSREGIHNYYAPNGTLIKKLNYLNDKLEGKGYYYDSSGNLEIEGNYKKGRKHGLWKYYKNGKLASEETYPKPLKNVDN
jgi:antitoxin component YwqK of YwqJK toxin-antitoxin module